MTRMIKIRFRRLVLIGAISAGAIGLAAGSAVAASAGVTPSPSPTYTQPQHHKAQPRHCEFVELTGITTDHDGQAQDVNSYAAPKTAQSDQKGSKAEKVEVFQLAKVCETGERLTVTDVSKPFAEESEQQQQHPQPSYSPSAYAPQS